MSFDYGMKAFKVGEYQQAAEYFMAVTEVDDQNHKAWNALGICLSKMGNFKQASICFDNALLLVPNNEVYERNKTKNEVKINKKSISDISIKTSDEKFPLINNDNNSACLTTHLNNDIQSNHILEQTITQYLQLIYSIDKGKIERKCLNCGESKGFSAIFSTYKLCKNCSKNIDNQKNEIFLNLLSSNTNIDNISLNIRKFIQLLTPMQQYQVMYEIFQQNPKLFNQNINSMFEEILPNHDVYSTNEDYLRYFYSRYIGDFYNINGSLPHWRLSTAV